MENNDRIAVQVLCDTDEEKNILATQMAVLTRAVEGEALVAVGCTKVSDGGPVTILCVTTEEDGDLVGYTPIGLLFEDPEAEFEKYLPPIGSINRDSVEGSDGKVHVTEH